LRQEKQGSIPFAQCDMMFWVLHWKQLMPAPHPRIAPLDLAAAYFPLNGFKVVARQQRRFAIGAKSLNLAMIMDSAAG